MPDTHPSSDVVELIRRRIGQDFDGECTLSEEETTHVLATIERLSAELERVKSKGHLCPNCGAFTSAALSDTKAG